MTSKFDNLFNTIVEDLLAGSGGAFGTSTITSGIEATDSYAPGDYRAPHALGARKQKRRKGKKKRSKMVVQRRTLNPNL